VGARKASEQNSTAANGQPCFVHVVDAAITEAAAAEQFFTANMQGLPATSFAGKCVILCNMHASYTAKMPW
jgi:hypothetical protein